jgi:hypothetical protein
VRQATEAAIGQSLQCEKSEGTIACEAKLGERRTAMTMTASEGRGPASLIGCFYYCQQ